MKKVIIILLFGCFLSFPVVKTWAQEATDTANEDRLNKLRLLKEKVAEKVAQLKNEENRVYSGEIEKIEDETISLLVLDKILKVETTNLTKFVWINTDGKKLTLSINDFTSGDQIVAWGLYNKETNVLNAKGVSGRIPIMTFACLVKGIDSYNNILTCLDSKSSKDISIVIDNKIIIKNLENKTGLLTVSQENIKKDNLLLIKGIKKSSKDSITGLLIIIINSTPPLTPPK